jgi:hypothetical protein
MGESSSVHGVEAELRPLLQQRTIHVLHEHA